MLFDERKNWDMFWLIDPLDGTIEFIKRNNEFTVNIALMALNLATTTLSPSRAWATRAPLLATSLPL